MKKQSRNKVRLAKARLLKVRAKARAKARLKARLAKARARARARARLKARLAKALLKARLAKARAKARARARLKARLAKALLQARLAKARAKARAKAVLARERAKAQLAKARAKARLARARLSKARWEKERLAKARAAKARVAKRERLWKKYFDALVEYKRKYGHCVVFQSHPGLAWWVGVQRMMWQSGELRPDRARLLERAGLEWSYKDALWNQRFAEMEAYRRRHGHCQVARGPKEYETLALWAHFQRVLKRKGRINAERARRLERIGFDWVSRGRSVDFRDSAYWDKKWDRTLAELAKFKRSFGHCWVPTGWPGNSRLAHWVSRQRELKEQGLLNERRRRKLDALGIDWRRGDTANPRWERCFLRLLEFKRRFGHCHVPAEWAENITMGRWAVKTRRLKKSGRLSADKVRRLDEVGFVWDAIGTRQVEHDVLWNERLDKLVAFRQKYGHWRVPTEEQRFHRLRVWMDNQRINYQRGWLPPERIQKMEAIGFPWLSDRQQELAAAAGAGAEKKPSPSI